MLFAVAMHARFKLERERQRLHMSGERGDDVVGLDNGAVGVAARSGHHRDRAVDDGERLLDERRRRRSAALGVVGRALGRDDTVLRQHFR